MTMVIFAWNAQWWYWLMTPIPSPCPFNFCSFYFYFVFVIYFFNLPPFGVVLLWHQLNFSKLSTAECWTVTTVCMLIALKCSTQARFLSCYCACQQAVFNFLNYSLAYLQYHTPVCFLSQCLVLLPLSSSSTPQDRQASIQIPWWM